MARKRSDKNIKEDSDENLIKHIYVMHDTGSNELKLFEKGRIYDIQHSLTVFADESTLPIVSGPGNAIEAMNLSALYVKNIAIFCKRLISFKIICLEDQMTLLKWLVADLLFVRFAFIFQPDKNGYYEIAVNDFDNISR